MDRRVDMHSKRQAVYGGKTMIKSPRGTSDVLPPESAKWIYLEGIVREVARRYNFDEIRLPTFEHSELFSRTVGETTDIVEKEMYTFKDKTGRDLTLRPEGTAGVARAFLEHGMASGPSSEKTLLPRFDVQVRKAPGRTVPRTPAVRG
jgi:histidyl-tRNA synthetase